MADAVGAIGSSPAELTLGTTYTDNIASSGDIDYFQLPQQSKNSQVTIDLTGLSSSTNDLLDGASGEFKLSIVNASDTAVSTVTKGVSNTASDLTASILANTNYYLKVEKGTAFSSSNYSIKASMIETVESETSSNANANDTIAQADVIVPGASFTGTIGHSTGGTYVTSTSTDVDVFAFTTGNTDGKTVTVTIAPTASDATFYTAKITDSGGQTQTNANNAALQTTAGSSNGSLTFTLDSGSGGAPGPGTYYLWIQANDTDAFKTSSEAGSSYTITLGGTTDYNQPPTVTIGSAISGLYGSNNVENSTTKTVSLNAGSNTFADYLSLSTLVTATDPDTDTANAAIANYFIGLQDTTVESANGVALSQRVTDHANANLNLVDNTAVLNAAITISGSGDESGVNFLISGTDISGSDITETIAGPNNGTVTTTKLFKTVTSINPDANTSSTNTITVGANTSGRIVYDSSGNGTIDTAISGQTSTGSGFLNSLTAAQFATAKYIGATAAETGQQKMYVAVQDNSGAGMEALKTSGIAIQAFNSKNVSVSVSDAQGSTALKEGDASTNHSITFTLPGSDGDGSITSDVRVVLVNSDDLTYSGDISNRIVTLTDADKSDTVTVAATSDGNVEGTESVQLSFTVTSDDAAYEGLAVSPLTLSVKDVKASFTASALDYGADSVDNSLKAEGLSQTSSAVVAQNSSLALDGALASAASSGFASPHRITITSTGDDSSGAIFVITGTDANSGAQTVEIQGGAAGKTVTTAESFKTVSSITVKNGSADTAGTVSAGIASILEGDTGDNQKATYTITATDFPSSTTLTLNLSSTATAVFNYGTANESTSRDFTDADEGTPITVTVLAAQDSTDELNPHMPTITHAIYEGSNVATAYVGEIADITVAVQDNNVPTASDGIVQTAKQEDNIVSALSSGVVDTTNGLTIATGTFAKAHKVTITSTGDDSGITYTIVGTDANGSAQTETNITGATAGNTATSTKLFKTITSIKPVGGPSADTVKAGIYPQITFAASDFGYLDADGDLLNKITINTLPTSGELKKGSTVLTSSNLSSNNVLTAKELADGDLVFTPAAGGSGSGYGNFTYTVNDGLQDAASANTMKVNIGDAVDVTVKSWKQVSSADVPVKNQTVTLKSGANYHDGVAVSGTFTTNDTGKLDLTGVPDGTHTAGYTIAKNTSYAITQQALEMTDVLDIYDFFVGARTPTADQVVASNVTWATAGDTVLGMDDVLTAYDMFVGKDGADAYVILRDASAAAATYNAGTTQITNASSSFEIQAGNSITLQAYFLGDTDGGYTTPLLA